MLQSAQEQAELGPYRAKRVVAAPAVRRRVSWTCAWAVAGLVAATDLAAGQTKPTNAPIEFNIPPQSLGTALSRYVDVTGRDALYDTSLAAGRVSGDVRGVFAPDEALRKLLSGTGLAAEFVAEMTFVLLPAPSATQQAVQQTRSPEHRRYYGLIQASLADVLCRSGTVRPGHYRFVAVFWIAPDGAVRRSQRIGSTGTPESDLEIDVSLRSVRFNEPPPCRLPAAGLDIDCAARARRDGGLRQDRFRRPAGRD